MREEDSNWFSRWEEDLPSPEELMPLSQTLISPDLALAFDIRNPTNSTQNYQLTPPTLSLPSSASPTLMAAAASSQPNSMEFAADSTELVSGGPGCDEPARTLKRPRLVWTPQLHKRFVDAVAHLGIKNAVPKTIMQLMSVDGLTRENVASHLQKYRLYLKRMQGLSGGGGGNGGGMVASSDPATDHLFASSPVPPHFLHPGRGNSDNFMPSFVPVSSMHHHHHHQHQHHQISAAAAAAAVGHPPHLQTPYHRQIGHFGSPPNNQFEHSFLGRQTQQPIHRIGAPVHNQIPGYVEDMESGNANSGRKILTLFPTGDD